MSVSSFLKVFICAMGIASVAAIPVRQAGPEKRGRYLDGGVFVGGYDHGPLTLLSFRYSLQNDKKSERLVFDLGKNESGEAEDSAGRAGFFHIAIQKSPRRIVMDLENVASSKVDAGALDKLFQKSPRLLKAHFYFDNRNKNLTIEIPLKAAASLEVFELVSAGKPGRIVLDIKGQ